MAALIDTNVAVFLRDNNRVIWEAVGSLDVAPSISVLTCVELEGGISRVPAEASIRRHRVDVLLQMLPILPFTAEEAAVYGRIVAEAGFARGKIIDRMIAATAIAARLPLITLSPRDFRDIPDLEIKDWS